MVYLRRVLIFLLLSACLCSAGISQPAPDKPWFQPVSVQYNLQPELTGAKLSKLVVDYNDIVYALSDKGLLRLSGMQLVRDTRYTPLADEIPVDIFTQEGTGHLFYLFNNRVLTNGYAGVPYYEIPANRFSLLAVSESGDVLLAGAGVATLIHDGRMQNLEEAPPEPRRLFINEGKFYVQAANGIYTLKGNRFQLLHAADNITGISFGPTQIFLGTPDGYYSIDRVSGSELGELQIHNPANSIRSLLYLKKKLWAGTANGLFMRDITGRFRYFASRRWLKEDDVSALAADSKGNIYALTASGISKIEFRLMTLHDKAEFFQNRIRQSHIRYGLISEVSFTKPGDPSTARMVDTDNDGLWTAFYLGSQAFRYAVTKEKTAKRYAWEAFEAYERLVSINPLHGFSARTFERKGFKNSDPSVWHVSPDTSWEWKGTTSSDEFVGYIWIASLINEFVAETPSEHRRVADYMDRILTHLLEHNYCFIDANGKPTLWGRWDPDYINHIPATVGDRKLGSVIIIAGLQLGYSLTGKEIYKEAAYKLMYQSGYLENMMTSYSKIGRTAGVFHMGIDIGSGSWNHSDDEMAFLTYRVLYRYAFTPELRKKYAWIIHDHWQIEKPERNAVWNLVSLETGGSFDKSSTLWHLRGFPLDLVSWTIRNSQRKDLEFLPENFREQSTKELIPPDEAPLHRHNANAFQLDGGNGGRNALAGDEFLLPYWMARYLKVID